MRQGLLGFSKRFIFNYVLINQDIRNIIFILKERVGLINSWLVQRVRHATLNSVHSNIILFVSS